jgi:hypothetical protein
MLLPSLYQHKPNQGGCFAGQPAIGLVVRLLHL